MEIIGGAMVLLAVVTLTLFQQKTPHDRVLAPVDNR